MATEDTLHVPFMISLFGFAEDKSNLPAAYRDGFEITKAKQNNVWLTRSKYSN